MGIVVLEKNYRQFEIDPILAYCSFEVSIEDHCGKCRSLRSGFGDREGVEYEG